MAPNDILADFHMCVYLLLSAHLGRLSLLQRDLTWAIDEITYGTTNVNRYEERSE